MKLKLTKTAKKPDKKAPVKIRAAASRASRRSLAASEEDEYYEESEPNMRLSHAFIVVLILHVIAVGGVFGFNTIKSRQSSLAKLESEAAATASASTAAQENEDKLVSGLPENIEPPAPVAAQSSIASTTQTLPPPPAPSSAPKTSKAAAGQRTHTVVAGDTLIRIARQKGTTVEQLMSTNKLGESSVIRVGQVLIIPDTAQQVSKPAIVKTTPKTASEKSMPVKKETASKATSSSGTVTEYVVEKGDNPYSIAKELKVSYTKLLEVNNIDDPTKLQIGQKLKIPASN
ncbi:MAG: LysM peptidoglycan-binding domain-containing protein [Chthoniobacterales bacterium]